MMLFAMTLIDAPGSGTERAAHHAGHIAHFSAHRSMIALAGPLLDEADDSAGSLVIVEAGSMAEARAFIEADPFFGAGVWRDIAIARFKASIHAADRLT